jgi:hypothetical protein
MHIKYVDLYTVSCNLEPIMIYGLYINYFIIADRKVKRNHFLYIQLLLSLLQLKSKFCSYFPKRINIHRAQAIRSSLQDVY